MFNTTILARTALLTIPNICAITTILAILTISVSQTLLFLIICKKWHVYIPAIYPIYAVFEIFAISALYEITAKFYKKNFSTF
jgi:hypothetical protein